MKSPDLPPNEEARLQDLHSLNILDTPIEERFDRVTRLAKRLFDVPIVVVSLIDHNRQWFKSCIGMGPRETSRELSFCGHAILDDQIFLVRDALIDDRFSDNPLVLSEPRIRFYAGYPLTVGNGSKIGTLCLIGQEPRDFSADDHASLRDLGEIIEKELTAIQAATIDDLTGLTNRRGFMAFATNALTVVRRATGAAHLLLFDLNGFKAINDRFGHGEGDSALRAFAGVLQDAFQNADLIARLGGDEFAVLIVNQPQAAIDRMLADFKAALDRHNKASTRGYQIRSSVGTAQFDPAIYATVTAFLEAADTAMYDQKRNDPSRTA